MRVRFSFDHSPPNMASRMPPPPSGLSRNVVIAGGVVLFHAAALWALQSGLLLRAVEVVVPVEILSQIIDPPKPAPPPPPPPPAPPAPPREPVVRPKAPAPRPAPKPMAIQDPTPAPAAPVGVTTPPAPLPPIEQPVAAAPEPAPPPPPAPPAPPRIQLPSTDAAYLQNPSPVYPAISRRLGEQGKVVVRVLIGTDGAPERVEIKRSSGFDRLDRAATDYVMKCRYVPGKVNGVVQAMWYEAPVNFVLE
jgi:protein TonB